MRPARGGVVNPDTGMYDNSPENAPLFDIAGDANGRAWAVGDLGTILAFEHGEWRSQATPTHANLRGITLAPDGQIYVAGNEGTVLTSTGDGQ